MPFRTIPDTSVTYALIAFDADGDERTDDPQGVGGKMSARILQDAATNPPSHVFFFSHGWKGDVPAAIDQYNRWIKAMTDLTADAAAMGPGFKPLWIGLHWPSLPWGDDELGSDSFDAVRGDIERVARALRDPARRRCRAGARALADHLRRERNERRGDDPSRQRRRRLPPAG